MKMLVENIVNITAIALETAGVGIIATGILYSAVTAAAGYLKKNPDTYHAFRRHVIRSILLGLEILIAADIIRTVAVEPTFTSVGVLALIIVVRTFLSFTLEVEVTGKWPWQEEQKTTVDPKTI